MAVDEVEGKPECPEKYNRPTAINWQRPYDRLEPAPQRREVSDHKQADWKATI